MQTSYITTLFLRQPLKTIRTHMTITTLFWGLQASPRLKSPVRTRSDDQSRTCSTIQTIRSSKGPLLISTAHVMQVPSLSIMNSQLSGSRKQYFVKLQKQNISKRKLTNNGGRSERKEHTSPLM
jgi:hypothetical protein